ncbi:PAS domain S-box protein [Gaiella occulta]|uniref:histidine kinase n=1 Tax=Gaiella occulta TaxID=1002870 RepID=A0A7M2YVL4_9ACTN|nr:response regulator [Gaiella occulta]RDI73507.1 PAS domain S-box protein [Gaiella occulta]
MSTFRALIADDDPDDRMLALRELRKEWPDAEAFEVCDAAGLEEALSGPQPQLVVTDSSLRFTDGLSILRDVRARWPDVPVVMLTGTGSAEVAVEALKSGLDDYVLKHHVSRLGASVRGVVDRRARELEARTALAESEERFRALADSSSLLIWITDADNRVTFVNRGWLDFTGRTLEQELGFGWLEGVHPDERDAVARQVLEYERSGRPYALRYRILDAAGEYRTLVDSGSPRLAADGTLLGYAGTSLDITDQLRAESARVEAEVLLTTALEAAPVGLGFVDRDLRYVRVNEALAEFHGSPVDAHLGRKAGQILEPLGLDLDAVYRRVLDTGVSVHDVDIETAVAGARRRFRAGYHPVRVHDEIVGVAVVAVETTERDLLEAQLLQAQKLEAVGRLAAGLAHDFNNLLGVIDGYASLIAEALPEGDERRAQALEISRASMRGADLTRSLLVFSRQKVVAERDIDLCRLVAELARMLERLVPDDVELTIDLGDEPAVVCADAGRLEQVIVNLVVNAVDAIRAGGRISVRVRPRGQDVVLEVEDTGVGIAEEALPLLFEPFFTTKEQGTGLGLSTAYGIVKQAGGQLHVTSTVGAGSTFTVLLPRVDRPAATPLDEVAVREPLGARGGGETILVAEDNDLLRRLIRSVLEQAGFTVVTVEDGAKALEAILEHGPPAAVVADVEMPGMGGIELARRLDRLHPHVRVLLMSGYTAADEIHHLAKRDFLQKPFTPADLVARVRELLDR